MTATPKTATTAQIAEELGTTPRELRKFLRAEGSGVGKGARYALPANKTEMTKMKKNFANWAAAAKKAKEDKADKTTEAVTEDDSDITTDSAENDEPTDADLDEISLEEV